MCRSGVLKPHRSGDSKKKRTGPHPIPLGSSDPQLKFNWCHKKTLESFGVWAKGDMGVDKWVQKQARGGVREGSPDWRNDVKTALKMEKPESPERNTSSAAISIMTRGRGSLRQNQQ